MTSMTVDGHIRSMNEKRFQSFDKLLRAEIKAKTENKVTETTFVKAKEVEQEEVRDKVWLMNLDLEALRMLEQIVDQIKHERKIS